MDQDEILLELATAMICVQSMERCLVQVLSMALPGKKVLTTEQAEEFVSTLNRRTVGQLRDMLKDRAELHEAVLEVVDRVVSNRNKLAHGLLKLAKTPSASIVASLPVSVQLSQDSAFLTNIFNDLVMTRATELGITTACDDRIKAMIGEERLGTAQYLVRQKYPHKGEDQ